MLTSLGRQRSPESHRGPNAALPRAGTCQQDATFLRDVSGTRRQAAVGQRPAGSREGYVWLPKWISSTNFYESGRLVNRFILCASPFFTRAFLNPKEGGHGPDVPNFYPRSLVPVPGGAGCPGAHQVDSVRRAQSMFAHCRCKFEPGLRLVSTSRTHPCRIDEPRDSLQESPSAELSGGGHQPCVEGPAISP